MKNIYKVNGEAVKKKAERVYDNGSTVINRNDLEEMFPELKESEDEKIRKTLIEFHTSTININGISGEKIVAWLEKYGEQKPAEEYNITGISSKHAQGKLGEMIKNLKPVNEVLEQNHTDRVEPKFNVGEWITNGDYTWKIVEVKPLDYILQSQDGNVVDDTISHVDEQFHSFAIEDAKDGDVLNSTRVQATIIFKGFSNDGKHILAYCALQKGIFVKQEMLWDRDFEPAPKNWTDELFKKMKEAVYEWDAEKKELKKVERKHTPKHKVGDTIYYNSFGELKSIVVANIVTDSTDNPMYEDKEGNAVFEKDIIEQNLAWSEEDEMMIKFALTHFRLAGATEDSHIITWLKSLKDRVQLQPQQEWGEEDEKGLGDALWCCKQASSIAKDENDMGNAWYAEHWLNKLKECFYPQSHWKPTDEQMTQLKRYCSDNRPLTSLYEQLKKLIEE